MNLFFTLDLLIATAIVCSSYWIEYYAGNLGWLIFGSAMFLLFRIGICMEYTRDKADNRDKRYALMLFDKKYPMELLINICFVCVCTLAGISVWGGFFSGAMFHGAWVIALLHESGWRWLLKIPHKEE